jgi:uncharacterized protein (DUF1800 family)
MLRSRSLVLPLLLGISSILLGAADLNQREKSLHVIDRLGFGPRPGELEEVEHLGIDAWIQQQLHPESISDTDCDSRLESFPDIKKSALELYQESPPHKAKKNEASSPMMMNAEEADLANKKSNERIRSMQEQWEAAKLTRLVYSRRQLLELMTDFWYNHFNVSEQKNQDRWLFGPYERDVIRPNALGKFSELLMAVAKSPAMLAYLDNSQSTADLRYVTGNQKDRMEMAQMNNMANGKKQNRGLNENYARELLELHTMGVDSGYTQDDVIETARVLTGWSFAGPEPSEHPRSNLMQPPPEPFTFFFRAGMHDRGVKMVLGHQYGPDGGVVEGEALLEMLAHQPSTAHFLALKLCRHFVSDDPDPELVETVAAAYLQNDTDIPSTLMVIFNSPEFLDRTNYRAKVKTPLEYVVSSLRVTGAEISDQKKLDQILLSMGEPSYRCEPPTGYPDTASAWVSSSALLSRMNFGVQLFDPRHSPAPVNLTQLIPMGMDGQEELNALFKALLHGEVSPGTREVLEARLKDPEISHRILDDKRAEWQVGTMAALVLGSPEFQRR